MEWIEQVLSALCAAYSTAVLRTLTDLTLQVDTGVFHHGRHTREAKKAAKVCLRFFTNHGKQDDNERVLKNFAASVCLVEGHIEQYATMGVELTIIPCDVCASRNNKLSAAQLAELADAPP